MTIMQPTRPSLSDRRFTLATDLDGTFLGGTADARAVLYDWIEANRFTVGLIFVTGRDPDFILGMCREEGLPWPEYVVGDVGTTIARVTYLEVMGELELWNDTLSNPNSVTVENLEKAYNAYMAVIAEDLKNAKVDTANDLYAEAFFQLGKKHFKNKDMEVSKALISKGLEIDPNHAQLKDLYARWQRRQTGNEGFFDRFY